MIYQLIINTLTGAGTGYITNNIAIKMLFKKYFGRFGGIIEDTHDEFVENISKLIEKDLINHHTLNDEFNSEEFHKYIKDLIEDMFVYSLPKNSIALSEINGIYETTDNFVKFLDNNQTTQKDLKNQVASKPLKNSISYLQALHFSRSVVDVLSENKTAYMQDLISPLREWKLGALVSDELVLQLSKNINNIIYQLDISKFDEKIDAGVLELLENIKIDEIISFTQKEIENLYFKQMFGGSDDATKDFISRMVQIALSDEGQKAIDESVKAILVSLSEVKVSMLSLFDDEIKESIKLFVINELPNILNRIIEFIDQNEKDLEDLINDSIDKALDGGMFADFKKKVVSIFYTNIVADFEVLSLTKEYMHTYREQAQEEIIEQILDLLENKAIGDLYQEFAKRNIITPQKVITLIINNLRELKVDRNIELIDTILNKQVKDYTDVDLGFVKEKLIPHTLEIVKKEYIYSSKIKDVMVKETQNSIDEFKLKTIHEILGKRLDTILEKISNSIDNDELLNIVLSNAKNILDKPMNEVINIDEIHVDFKQYINDAIDGKSLKDIITYMQSDEVYEAVKNALIKVVLDNLEEILKGNVSEAIKHELSKLPPSQIKDMVEEFMGEELKPINYFGAALGGVAGAGVGLLSIPVWANPFIYAVVGVATNYLAIKMLFQPYSPLKIGKMKIPFSEGVLPSNKEKMSIKMSEFVDEFMLNGTSIHNFFQNNSESLKSFIKVHISQDDYTVIDKLIHQDSNISDMSNEAVSLIFKFLDTNHEMISEKVFNISMSYYDKREEYAHKAGDFVYQEAMKTEFKEFLYEQFDKYLDKESSLEFIADDILPQFDRFIEKSFSEFVELLADSSKIKELVVSFENEFEEFITTKALIDTIDASVKEKLSKKVNTSLLELFYGQETINEVLNFFTKGEFNANSKLSDMINGLMPKIIENNLQLILNETIVPALQENKPLIKAEIMQKVPFGMGWAVKRDVTRAMNIIIDTKVPVFLEEKIHQINEIVQEVLSTQLGDFGYSEDVINQQRVDELMRTVLTNENFEASFAKSMDIFVETVFNMKLKTILQIFNITNIAELYDVFEPNIQNIIGVLKQNVDSGKPEILSTLKHLAKDEIAMSIFESLTVNDLLKEIDKEFLLREFEHLEKRIKKSEKFEDSMRKVINDFIQIFIKKEFLDKEVFKDDTARFLKEILEDKEQLRVVLVPFFKEFIENINTILDLKLKDHMLEIVVDSAFDSIDKKILDLMGAIDFKKVITKEIQDMHPKELEDMFYSFAGPYFNKLILYGSLGFLFGLATIF